MVVFRPCIKLTIEDYLKSLFSQTIMVKCSREWSFQLFIDVVTHS